MTVLAKLRPWAAEPLNEASKDKLFRARMDVAAESVLLGRSAILAGWGVGIAGVACLAASIYGWTTLLPLKTTEVRFFVADKSTGIISQAISLADAPRFFPAAVEHEYLKRYIIAREGFDPNADRRNDHLVKIMSAPDEQARYERWRETRVLPQVAQDAYVEVADVRFHPEPAPGRDIHSYRVQFTKQMWRGMDHDPPQIWSAMVDFIWRPDLAMAPADRDDNAGGFQAIGYSSSADTGGTR